MAAGKAFGSRLALVAIASATIAACSAEHDEPIAVDPSSVAWDANDYCRTTTCDPPAGWPQGSECAPSDWADQCAKAGKWDVPLWWRTACVGWSMSKQASAHVAFADAESAATRAFGAWTRAACDSSRPSIDATELPAVDCDHAAYSDGGPNQNVIAFADTKWPHEDPTLTIALTTVTFDSRTGEIRDADIEVNEANFDVGTRGERYDLQAVLTHETGHFFGLAHSASGASVMNAYDEGGDVAKRALAKSDALAICAVYPPDGTRSVSDLVVASGHANEGACDTTPRGGFATACD